MARDDASHIIFFLRLLNGVVGRVGRCAVKNNNNNNNIDKPKSCTVEKLFFLCVFSEIIFHDHFVTLSVFSDSRSSYFFSRFLPIFLPVG